MDAIDRNDDDFDFDAIARRCLAEAEAAGDRDQVLLMRACLPTPPRPGELQEAWGNVIRNSSFGKPRPGVTVISNF